jgi:hypothetical protein
MAISPDQDIDARPAGTDRTHDVAQDPANLGAVGRLARPQEDRDRLARHRLVDVDRHETAAVVMRVEQRELLPAIGAILGVIDVEHDAPRHRLEAVAEQFDHRRHHPLERGRAGQVFEPADGRLRAQIRSGLRQATDRHLEGRVLAQRVAVIGIGIACRDRQRAETDHLGDLVDDLVRRAGIFDASRQSLGDLEPALDLGQQHNAAIRGQPAAIETGDNRLAADR